MIGQDPGAARAQQNLGVNTPVSKHLPAFHEIDGKIDSLVSLSQDLERRSIQANATMFGPRPETDTKDKKDYLEDSLLGLLNKRLDSIFENLQSVQENLNKLHIELGTNE